MKSVRFFRMVQWAVKGGNRTLATFAECLNCVKFVGMKNNCENARHDTTVIVCKLHIPNSEWTQEATGSKSEEDATMV